MTSESERPRIQIVEALKIFGHEKHNVLDMCGFVARTTHSTSASITVDAVRYHFLTQSNFASQSFEPLLERNMTAEDKGCKFIGHGGLVEVSVCWMT